MAASLQGMPAESGGPGWRRAFWAVLLLTTAWKLAVSSKLTLCFDEGYYHFWSCFPQLSYFDHPPLTAWLMALSNRFLGDTVWTVRLWPLLGGVLTAFLGRLLARRLFGGAAGDRAGVFLLLAPGFLGNGFLMTPDAPFVALWAAAVLCAVRAVDDGRPFSPWWLAAGAAAGFGFLAKYNMVLFFAGLGLYGLVAPGRRLGVFLGSAAAGLLALLIFSPVLLWNVGHEWASFRFQLNHGFGADRHAFGAFLGEYAGVLLLLPTPVLGALCFRAAGRPCALTKPGPRLAACFLWAVVLFFAVSSLKSRVQANWPLAAFFTGLALAAGEWPAIPGGWRRAALALLAAVDLAAMAYLLLPAQFPLAWRGRSLDPPRMKEFIGAPDIARLTRERVGQTRPDFVCAASYQLLGTLSFYAPELRASLWYPRSGRLRFPWIDDQAWSGRNALLVSLSRDAPDEGRCFDRTEDLGCVDIPFKGSLRRVVHFQLGIGYRPDRVATAAEELERLTSPRKADPQGPPRARPTKAPLPGG